MDAFFWIVITMILIYVFVFASAAGKRKKYPYTDKSPIIEESHRPHEPIGEYDSNHADRVNEHLVHHPKPEPGYVVLNGVKRRIRDCKNL